MIERKAYICEHCEKHRPIRKHFYLSKDSAAQHERTCFYNPSRKTCFTCMHNNYTWKGNVCKIEKNENYNREIDRCKELGISSLDNRYSELPKSMQIMKNCEHWVHVYEIEESEGE